MTVDVLKQKVIDEFELLLNKVECGYKPDYELILQEIAYINMPRQDTEQILQFYVNDTRLNLNTW